MQTQSQQTQEAVVAEGLGLKAWGLGFSAVDSSIWFAAWMLLNVAAYV